MNHAEIKQLILSEYNKSTNILIVDTDDEYVEMCKSLNGTIIEFNNEDEFCKLNLWDIEIKFLLLKTSNDMLGNDQLWDYLLGLMLVRYVTSEFGEILIIHNKDVLFYRYDFLPFKNNGEDLKNLEETNLRGKFRKWLKELESDMEPKESEKKHIKISGFIVLFLYGIGILLQELNVKDINSLLIYILIIELSTMFFGHSFLNILYRRCKEEEIDELITFGLIYFLYGIMLLGIPIRIIMDIESITVGYSIENSLVIILASIYFFFRQLGIYRFNKW